MREVSRTISPRVRALFWISAALLAWTQLLYAPALAALRRLKGSPPTAPGGDVGHPLVSLVVAAYNEEAVIAAKVANALALDWPRERLELIVAVDGAQRRHRAARPRGRCRPGARAAARRQDPRPGRGGARGARRADRVLGRERAVGAGRARAARQAVRRPAVGYVCGRVEFTNEAGTNQEGLYWRYEMWLRAQESALASVTGGNGAIYAVRREAYVEVDPIMGHDLSFPFRMVKDGWRAVYQPAARATEKMVPSIEGEWARKRRMMSHGWPIVVKGGLADPRGYPPLYALMIVSHRLLRYGTPLLHVAHRARDARAARPRAGLPARRRRAGRAARRARWPAVASRRGRCSSPATTCSRPPRSPPACTTGCATARRPGWDAPEGTR